MSVTLTQLGLLRSETVAHTADMQEGIISYAIHASDVRVRAWRHVCFARMDALSPAGSMSFWRFKWILQR
jgi:hypothetical protein